MNSESIVHISEIDISPSSGMGRVEYNWKNAFERKGFNFIHIGPKEVGFCFHKSLFPYKAYNYFKNLKIKPRAFIVHEPASGQFVRRGIPCFLESHGVERRSWENGDTIKSFITQKLYPIWRLRNCDIGLSKADKLLLINTDDKIFTQNKYTRRSEDIFIFKNGVNSQNGIINNLSSDRFVVLFNGTWIQRKGIHVLIEAAKSLYEKGYTDISYLLIGTGKNTIEVLDDWPTCLRESITVIEKFDQSEEITYLSSANLFVLPSFSEGQPLSMLQAMAAGKCCITTNCDGQKDIIINDETGLLFPIGDHFALSDLMIRCYLDRELIQKIGGLAKIEMKKRLWETVSDEVVDFVLKNT